MTVKNLLDEDLDFMFDPEEFGEPATYKPKNGAATSSIIVIPSMTQDLRSAFSPPAEGQYAEAFFGIRVKELVPQTHDKIELTGLFPGVDWQVAEPPERSEDGRLLVVKVYTSERAYF